MIEFRPLLNHTLEAIAICAAAVIVCCYFVGGPVAFFVHRRAIARFEEFR